MAGHSMSVYVVSDDNKVFPKALPTATAAYSVLLKDGCSIDNPVISVHASAAALALVNYAYIPDFGRYYYRQDIKSLNNGICEVTLLSDPLQSFAKEIKNAHATLTRSENLKDGYLIDSGYKARAFKKIVHKEFPNALDDWSIILMTVG